MWTFYLVDDKSKTQKECEKAVKKVNKEKIIKT